MKPVDFPQSNMTFKAGDIPNCTDLHVHNNGKESRSLWELSGDELAQILQSKRIWLFIHGEGHPPVSLEVDDLERPMFGVVDTIEEEPV